MGHFRVSRDTKSILGIPPLASGITRTEFSRRALNDITDGIVSLYWRSDKSKFPNNNRIPIATGRISMEQQLNSSATPINKPYNLEVPFMLASESARDKANQILLAQKADLNLQGPKGKTPLISAIAGGNATDVDYLITSGASVTRQDEFGLNCLHEAVLNHANPTILDILISAGADPDVQDISGVTPLLVAVRRNDVRSVDVLLTYGADINIQDGEGWAPVLVAVANNFHELLKLLLIRGADCGLRIKGRSVTEIAAVSGDIQTIKILTEAGLKI